MVVRAAPLTHGPQAGEGYAITLESARSDDLAPLLMRAWALTPREREVARLAIFAKTGVSSRGDLIAALAGQPPG